MKKSKMLGMEKMLGIKKLRFGYRFGINTAVLAASLIIFTGCTRLNRSPTCEEEIMVKETLMETSPRALNDQPKAIPEFKFTFGGPKRRCVEMPAREEFPSDRDIYLENH